MSVSITNHTTASSPRPHVLYQVNSHINGIASSIYRRYSEFATLHEDLKDPFNLPPKRYLTTTFIPSAWVDDALISERKSGLTEYLNNLLSSQEYEKSQALLDFLTAPEVSTPDFSLEDALPSTLSKKTGATLSTKVSGDVDANASPIAAAYYPGWASGTKSPESIDFSKFDILFFAFATPSSSAGLSFDSGGTSILKRLVTAAHNSGKGTKVVLSIGGWGGCQYFSQSVNSSHRSTFVTACKNAVNTYNLDGIDIDWEYPNSPGAGQPYSSSDSSNLLTFYKNLRTAIGSSKIISSAVTHLPYLGSNGSPLKDVSAYAAVMNYVNIMNYDVWGASSTPGPNAPYGNLCGTSKQPQANAQAAISQWTAAGFPASKASSPPRVIIMGLPLYGYVSQSSKTVLTGSLMPSSDMLVLQQSSEPPTEIFNELPEDSDRPYIKSPNEIEEISNTDTYFLNGAHPRSKGKNTTAGKVTVQANLQSWYGQQIPFNEIVKAGALSKKSDGTYGEAGGFTMAWDNCSNTPYLYNTSQKTVVTYDDTWSLADKATLAKSKGLAGVMTWSLDQDDGYTLQNAIRKALGK